MSSSTDVVETRELSERVLKLERLVAELGIENLNLLLLLQMFIRHQGLNQVLETADGRVETPTKRLDAIWERIDEVVRQALHDDR